LHLGLLKESGFLFILLYSLIIFLYVIKLFEGDKGFSA
jgi:hypothetical protein